MPDKKVLVVDDEIHIVQVVAIKLRNNGFEVLTAEDGQQALEIATSQKPDIIVTDFQMPVMTGLELIKELRKRSDTSDIGIIMLTARGFSIEDDQKDQLNISACLSKPFSPRELLEQVEKVLQQKAAV